jgi:hypothetical protein
MWYHPHLRNNGHKRTISNIKKPEDYEEYEKIDDNLIEIKTLLTLSGEKDSLVTLGK